MKVLSPELTNSSRLDDASGGYPPTHPSIYGLGGRLKRIADISGAIVGFVFLSPLLVLVALGIRIQDGGSVFYRQDRVGLDGRVFTILKFRTMIRDAEYNRGPTWSKSNDPRCTRFGALLRRSGLDELPQLWNIIKGDISLVGPRPERPEFVHNFRTQYPDYQHRHSLLGGLTGYSQAHGWRGDTDLGERLRHDLYYVRNWSLSLDCYILLLTLLLGWSDKTRNGIPR